MTTTFADQFPDADPPEAPARRPRVDPRRGLPRLPILWTLDQVAAALNMTVPTLMKSYLWLDGRDVGVYRKRYLRAFNMSRMAKRTGPGASPLDWRVPEGELIRWMNYHGLWVYDPAAYGFDNPLNHQQRADLRRTEHDGRVFVSEPSPERLVRMYRDIIGPDDDDQDPEETKDDD